ncbi:MAG: phosphate ABC transporter substrate-binding/OmpA family protein [Planctomycetota bacterium]
MSKGKLFAVCVLWLMIAAALAVTYRYLVYPRQRDQRLSETSSESHYQHTVTIALDSFSGYAILRSQEFKEQLSQKRIRLELVDDGANYSQRIKALDRGRVDMAAFTVDALIKVSASLDTPPATILAVIDESRGADAIVAYKQVVPEEDRLDTLNRADMRFVVTPDSPSETLARAVISSFGLDNLPPNPFVAADDAEDVFHIYRSAKPDEPRVYVLWEPHVAKILANPNTHIISDTSKFRGFIVDVLVAGRDFLVKNEELAQEVVGAYFRAAHHYRQDMPSLVYEDAKLTGIALSPDQAQRTVNGIRWKNTQENFAHFGLRPNGNVPLLEDTISKITRVLTDTGAIERDPTEGDPGLLYYDKILADLKNANFHPGLSEEQIREETVQLVPLTDREWDALVPIGTLSVPELVFARGRDVLTGSSRVTLDELAKQLESFPFAYVLVKGNASTQGDLEANAALAQKRAQAAEAYLVGVGVDPQRIRAVGGEPSGRTSVSFVLGQPAY